MLPFQFKLLTWVVVSKKGSESPDPCCGLGHGIVEGVTQRDVATCRIICVLPILPALGGFNKTKNVKLKPNLFFFKTLREK